MNNNQEEITQIQNFLNQQKEEFIANQINTNNNKKQKQHDKSSSSNNNKLHSSLSNKDTPSTKDNEHKTTRKESISIATHNVRDVNNLLNQNNIILEMQM